MDKPIILQIKETEEKLTDIINHSELPAFFLIRILDRMYKDLQPIEQLELSSVSKKVESETKKESDKNVRNEKRR